MHDMPTYTICLYVEEIAAAWSSWINVKFVLANAKDPLIHRVSNLFCKQFNQTGKQAVSQTDTCFC